MKFNLRLILLGLLILPMVALAQADTTTVETIDEIYSEDSLNADSYSEVYDDEQEEATLPTTTYSPSQLESMRRYQEEELAPRKIDRAKWKQIVGANTYEEKPLTLPKTNNFKLPSPSPMTLKVIGILTIVALLGVIIYFLLRNVKFGARVAAENVISTSIAGRVEDLAAIDLQALLEQALNDGDYRRAVRIHFLQLLKQLDQAQLIAWTKDKTNKEYLNELLSEEVIYQPVRRLTLAYELTWYGDRAISYEKYNEIAIAFHDATAKIQLTPNAAA